MPGAFMTAAQNCDAQMENAAGQVVASFGNVGRGIPPCNLQVTNAGTVIIYDSQNVVWSVNGQAPAPAANSGQVAVGQILQQVQLLLLLCLETPLVSH